MNLIRDIYLKLYFLIYILYIIFNKGIAYSFLVELLWFFGIALIFLNRNNIYFIYNKKSIIIYILLFVSNVYLFIGFFNYPILEVIKDSFVFNYAFFFLIIISFINEKDFIWEKLEKIYKWYPLIPFLSFSIFNLFTFIDSIKIFGNITIMNYKHSDMAIHLLISTIFFLNQQFTKLKVSQYLQILFIFFDLLIIASYSRSGTISFLIGLGFYLYLNKENIVTTNLKRIMKLLVIGLIIVIPIYSSLQIKENFQGRTLGFNQIKNNFLSIVASNEELPASLEDNKIWRLVWWGKIINYSFTPQYFFTGRGLGMSLVKTDGIETEDSLRSPHNYHLTIMARFGVLIFFLWIYFLFLIFKDYFRKKLFGKVFLIISILLAFVINSSFDVFLEGPMGAFPFWTFIGLLIIEEYNYKPNETPA